MIIGNAVFMTLAFKESIMVLEAFKELRFWGLMSSHDTMLKENSLHFMYQDKGKPPFLN